MTLQSAATDVAETTVDTIGAPGVVNPDVRRYPGSPPFDDSDLNRLLFRGRAQETDEVLHSILSHDLLVVYAVSGMGKTSLLQAGVLEPLRQRGYFPVIVRPSPLGRSLVELIDAQIRDAGKAAENITVTRFPGDGGTATAATTLWDLLAGLEIWKGNTLQRLVLILDQFEELFTLGWSDEERDRFIEQFGEVVRRNRDWGDEPEESTALPPPNVKFVLTIREDFLGHLEALAPHVPQIMQCRFRLEGLGPDRAEEAIRDPAAVDDPRLATPRFGYSPGAIDSILTFLRTKDERGSEVLTRFVDPSQLQIVLQYIETTIVPRKAMAQDGPVEVTENDLGGRLGLERIVGDFYRRQIESVPLRHREALRKLCETGLISQSGRRLSLEEGEILTQFGVAADALADLVERRLLRAEPRVGSVYYELAHDTLTAPIVDYRDEKRRAKQRRRRAVVLAFAGAAAVALAVVAATVLFSEESEAYQFATDSDSTYLVEIQPDEGLDAVVGIIGPNGAIPEVNAGGPDVRETVVVRGQGQWTVVVRGASAEEFETTVSELPSSDLEIGGRLADQPVPLGGVAVFSIEAPSDSHVRVGVEPSVAVDASVQVFGPDGERRVVGRVGRTGPWSDVVGGRAGRYDVVVRVSDYDESVVNVGETQSRDFDITVQHAETEPIDVGGQVTGAIDRPGDVMVYEFVLLDELVVVQVAPGDDFDTALDVIAPDGSIVTADDVGAGGIEQLAVGGQPGTYRAVVIGDQSSPGSFELTLRPDAKSGK